MKHVLAISYHNSASWSRRVSDKIALKPKEVVKLMAQMAKVTPADVDEIFVYSSEFRYDNNYIGGKDY